MPVLGMIKSKRLNRQRRNVYNSSSKPAYNDYPIYMSDLVQELSCGGINLPSDEFYQMHALSAKDPPPSMLGGLPPKVLQKL